VATNEERDKGKISHSRCPCFQGTAIFVWQIAKVGTYSGMLDQCWRRSAPDRFRSQRTRGGQYQSDMAGLLDWDSVEEWLSLRLIARRSRISAGQS
jgi:hypothetical protein